MDTTNTLWLDAYINDLEVRQTDNRRDCTQGHWDGYCSTFSQAPGTFEGFRDDIRRRERMAEDCYEI